MALVEIDKDKLRSKFAELVLKVKTERKYQVGAVVVVVVLIALVSNLFR